MLDNGHKGTDSMRKVLMLAYVFPPFFSVGGSIRIVKFIKYLPALGWLPVVLTIDDSREYDTQRKQGSEVLLKEISSQVKIYRTTAGEPTVEFLEKGRSLRRKNRFAAILINLLRDVRKWARRTFLLPDENILWLPFGLKTGKTIVQKEGIDIIFVTCPPHSISLVGVFLKMLTRKPLVVDYRDDWIDTPWFGSKPRFSRWIERRLERLVVRTADKVVLVTDWSKRAFEARYPGESPGKFILVPNGCDLDDYQILRNSTPPLQKRFSIVHAGLLSVAEDWRRSPEPFFQAINNLKVQNPSIAANLKVIFTGNLPERYRDLVSAMNLTDVVEETGFLPRAELLKLMQSAGLLLAINYEGFLTLIPGKIYDYWAVGGPPILLLSCEGAAQSLIERHRLGATVLPDDVQAIQDAISEFYSRYEKGQPIQLSLNGIEAYDRKELSKKMAQTFAHVLSGASD